MYFMFVVIFCHFRGPNGQKLEKSARVQPLPFMGSRGGGSNFKIDLAGLTLEFLESIGLGSLPSKTKKLSRVKVEILKIVILTKMTPLLLFAQNHPFFGTFLQFTRPFTMRFSKFFFMGLGTGPG